MGPLLIDADGLNNLDQETLKERLGIAVITPHPRELSDYPVKRNRNTGK